MNLDADWSEPLTNSPADREACERSLLFNVGIFSDPIILGDWPDVVKVRAGKLLQPFSQEEKRQLQGSVDFFALNHYTSRFVGEPNYAMPSPGQGFDADMWVNSTVYSMDGKLIGPMADSSWLYVTPQYFGNLLHWIHARYPKYPIYITENGVDVPGEGSMPRDKALNDTFRINYLRDYINAVEVAIDQGVPIEGYFVWSLLDNFEWADGYTKRFGIHYVDYANNQTRHVKQSASWYSNLIANTTMVDTL